MRKRSTSIYAKSSEEFIEKYNLKTIEKTFSKEFQSDYHSPTLKTKISLDTQKIESAEIEEKKLTDAFDQLNNGFKTQDKEKILGYVFNYCKEKNNYEIPFIRGGLKNQMTRSLTYDSLSDLNVNEAIESIITPPRVFEENDPHCYYNSFSNFSCKSFISTNSSDNDFNTLLSQNLEIKDEVLKIMIIGCSMVGKTLLLSNFLDGSFIETNYVYFPTSGMEIKKVVLKLNDKKVRIEFYDTDVNIHQKEIINTFYKICNGFFYIVDPNISESFEFVKNIHKNIINNSNSNTSFYMILRDKKSIDYEKENGINNFCDMANITISKIKLEDFNQKNKSILNFLNNIVLRKVSTHYESKRKKNSVFGSYKLSEKFLTNLSAFSDYKMVEEKTDENSPYLDKLSKHSKFRRLSYNEKLSKK